MFIFSISVFNTLINKSAEVSSFSFNTYVIWKIYPDHHVFCHLTRGVFTGSVKKMEKHRTSHRYKVGGQAGSQPHHAEIISTRRCSPPVISHHATHPEPFLIIHSLVTLASQILVSSFSCGSYHVKHDKNNLSKGATDVLK